MLIHKTNGGLHISIKDDDPNARHERDRMLYLLGCYGPFINYAEKWRRLCEEKDDQERANEDKGV